MAEAMEEC